MEMFWLNPVEFCFLLKI